MVGDRLEAVIGTLREGEKILNEVCILISHNSDSLVSDAGSLLVERIVELVEGLDLLFVRVVKELLELLNLGARLVVELLELEDVIGDGSRVHLCWI